MQFVNLNGKTFGRLKVLGTCGIDKNGGYLWKCLCECGTETRVKGYSLTSGHTKSCGCRHRWLASILHKKDKIRPGAAFRKILRQYKISAKTRGISWMLTDEQFRDIVVRPCHYTGRLPSAIYTAASGETFVYSGVDRKDSDQGYTLGNCVPCCAMVNWAKKDTPYDAFLQMVRETAICMKL